MAILLLFVIGGWQWRSSLGLMLAFWITFTALQNVWSRVRGGSRELGFVGRLRAPSRSYYGMQLAHVGVAVFIAGITVVTTYQNEKDVKMNIGDTVSVGGYVFRLNNIGQVAGPNYQAVRADIEVTKNGAFVAVMNPEKRSFTASQNVTTETAIDRSIFRDLYLALGDEVEGNAWTVRVYHKPLVTWIWVGALLMEMGGSFAITAGRYGLPPRKRPDQRNAADAP